MSKKGSRAHYIWMVMELEYLCRMRGIECRNLSENQILDDGLRVNRTKGSHDNIVQWNPRLRGVIRVGGYQRVWQRFIKQTITNGVIEESERFSLHDLECKGVTDTHGTRQEKQEASDHRSEQMLDIYDKSVPLVKPASD